MPTSTKTNHGDHNLTVHWREPHLSWSKCSVWTGPIGVDSTREVLNARPYEGANPKSQALAIRQNTWG